MDKTTSDILEKVQKLMALGNSPSEAEASSALEKARMLLARYGLSLADVKTASSEIVQNVILKKKRLRAWESSLIQVICKCTFTQAIHIQRDNNPEILVIGRELNTLAAVDLFEYLHNVVLKLGRAHSSKEVHLESFRRGVVHRIGERLYDLSSTKDQCAGPWVEEKSDNSSNSSSMSDFQVALQMDKNTSKENEDFISKQYGKTTTKKVKKTVYSSSFEKGKEEGDKVSLNRQIK